MVFIASFLAYLATAAPLVTAGDSGELAAAAACLGVPHPPGYPLYVLAGGASLLLPFGGAAYRLAVMSGLCMAGCAALVYAVSAEGSGTRGPAPAAAAAAWAFGLTVWTQATYAEVYPLQLLLSLSAVYSSVRAARSGDTRWFYLSSLAAGLSVAGHYAAVIFLPALIFAALWYSRPGRAAIDSAVNLFFFIAGLSVFLYLPLRASRGPAVNWGDPDTAGRLAAHLTRAAYGDIAGMLRPFIGGAGILAAAVLAALALAAALLAGRGPGLSRRAGVFVAACAFGVSLLFAYLGASWPRAGYLAEMAWSSGSVVALPLAVLGLAAVHRQDRGVFWLMAVLLCAASSVTFYRIPEPGTYNYQALADKFFLPTCAVIFVLAAAGAGFAVRLLARARPPVSYLPFAAVAVPVWLVFSGFAQADRSADFTAHDYSTALMRTLEQDAVFLAEGDNHVFLAAYQRVVAGARKDVDVFTFGPSPFPSVNAAVGAMADRRRPVYASSDTVSGIKLEPAGLLNRMPSPYSDKPRDIWQYYFVRTGGGKRKSTDFLTRFMAADYYFSWARDRMMSGDTEGSLRLLDEAVAAGRDIIWVNVAAGGIYLKNGRPDKARSLLEHALAAAPGNPEAHLGMGRYYAATGMPDEAERELVLAVKLRRSLKDAWLLLADVRQKRGDIDGAKEALRGYLGSGGENLDVAAVSAWLSALPAGTEP